MSDATSVLIADDHAISSSGLQQLLAAEPDFQVFEPVTNGLDAVAVARVEQPSLVILDYAMPGLNGLEAMREIRRWCENTFIVLLTGSSSNALMQSFLASCVDGLFLKTTAPDKILDGLKKVIAGEKVVGPGITLTEDTEAISPRELQILACIAEGLTNQGAAEKLSISVKTVESHRGSLMRKLEVRSTASLLVQAVQRGLIDL